MIKPFLTIFLAVSFSSSCFSQQASYPFYQLYQLDSLSRTDGIGRHFGLLYFDFLNLVEKQLEKADTLTTRLLRHFEQVFAQFYIDACSAHENKKEIPLPAWRTYFTDTRLQFYQYYLLGANAHLNGGLSEAIADSYTPAEWSYLKKKYVLFNKCLNKTYHRVYKETMENSKRARLLAFVTLGLAKPVGQYFLFKWRKRQMRCTEYRYTSSPKYQPLAKKISEKKEKVDRLVLTQF